MKDSKADGEHNMLLVLLNIENLRLAKKKVIDVFSTWEEIIEKQDEFTEYMDDHFDVQSIRKGN
ncbi:MULTISPECIES: hypothetical protein [unclassified Bacillus (in: firmicutes)]|uniref:hypothetical protein n=1 Tax=unclassified Bacillus (in: firmicutes) TaxID=185979 RepID=UPI0011457A76|nr:MULTISPECIES: hypothetical protein [unclassified Bacillus (in: firmicutes)]